MTTSITYQGHQIHCSMEGSGQAIVLLHGWPTNSRLWTSQVEALRDDHKVITFDWLGFGASDKPRDHHYTFTAKKEVLATVLSELLEEGEKVTLVAHDIGGPPAILWASENEERVDRLILLNTILYTFKTKLDAFSEVLLTLPMIKDWFVSPWGLRQVMRTNTRSRGKALNQKIEEILAPYVHVANDIKRKTLQEPMEEGRRNEIKGLSERFGKINAPKYLVMAKQDPLCYAHIKKLSEENPEVPAFTIKNCGHFMPVDRPEALNEVLVREIVISKRV